MLTILAFVLVLSGLILVHELGHYCVARLLGVRVLKFSLGFGPRVVGWIHNGTDYCISAVPLGGFVKMLGEQPGEEVPPEEEQRSFSHRPVAARAAIVAAGPLSNLLFAWLIMAGILLVNGNPVLLPLIGEVQKGSPAAAAGIVEGDKIIEIAGKPVATWDDVARLIRREGKKGPINVVVERHGKRVAVVVEPTIRRVKDIFGQEIEVPMIGITAAGKLHIDRVNPAEALALASVKTWDLIVLTGKGFVKIIQRVVPLSTLGGPILIAQLAGQQAHEGMVNLLYFMALLSVNLGLINLFPIPVLDGGHLFFFALEALLRRPLTPRQMELAQQVGIAILGALMLLVFYNDIARLLGILPAPGQGP